MRSLIFLGKYPLRWLVGIITAGMFDAGIHKVIWNSTDDQGQRVSSGVYIVVIKAGDFFTQKKLILTK